LVVQVSHWLLLVISVVVSIGCPWGRSGSLSLV
jgi:hypothetical protein